MTPPGNDHVTLPDPRAMRRYFGKFSRIIRHLREIAGQTGQGNQASLADDAKYGGGEFANNQLDLIENYLQRLAKTFTALSLKHLMSGRVSSLPLTLAIDRSESGFPVFQEIMTMANDLAQVDRHLANQPDQARLKEEMIAAILSERARPTNLQYAMSQRIYYETLKSRGLFFAQNHPQFVLLSDPKAQRRRYLLHWAVYDSALSLPVIYLLVVEDTGHVILNEDQMRWPQVQSHLMAQSLSSLKLLTIARGFDVDFDNLHPKLLRRIHVGPMYSHAFTEQTGPLREILAEVSRTEESDWALAWTIETLVSARSEKVPAGLLSTVEREIFDLDQYQPAAAEAGVTRLERSLVLPVLPYQVLVDRDPPGFRDVRKYVVGEDGSLLTGL
ncbi:hypothetical protein [Labrys sp. 22185]|uniref:hypothetical protein n=1 Tax=Labrys sp. 22185 TaxID=3453888 RepID=UPI003F86D0E6